MEKHKHLTIPMWSAADRPREKFLEQGKESLSDAELLAILLRSGTREESALDLAKRLLASNGQDLNNIAAMSFQALTKFQGIGTVKAITLQAAFELAKRKQEAKKQTLHKIKTAEDIVNLMFGKMYELKHEEFWALYLNQGNAVLKMENIGKGGITSTSVDVRLIMKTAVEVGATRIAVCHNHPSGSVAPSHEDIQLTNQIREAANLFNITLIDHVVIHNREAYSFFEEGLL